MSLVTGVHCHPVGGAMVDGANVEDLLFAGSADTPLDTLLLHFADRASRIGPVYRCAAKGWSAP